MVKKSNKCVKNLLGDNVNTLTQQTNVCPPNLLGDNINTQTTNNTILGTNVDTQINKNIEKCEFDNSIVLGYDSGYTCSDCGGDCYSYNPCPAYCGNVCQLDCTPDCDEDRCPDCACDVCNYPDCTCDDEPCSCNSDPCSSDCASDCSSDCPTFCSGDSNGCPTDRQGCPIDCPTHCESNIVSAASYGYQYVYYAFTPIGTINKDGENYIYRINWLESQSGDLAKIKFTGSAITNSTTAVVMSSYTVNNDTVYYVHGKSPSYSYAAYSGLTSATTQVTISIPGHDPVTTNVGIYNISGSSSNNAKTNFNNAVTNKKLSFSRRLFTKAATTSLSLDSSTNISNDNTKYTGVKYTFTSPRAIASSSGVSYTLYRSANEIALSGLKINCPFPSVNVTRTRTGFNYTSNGNFTLTTTGDTISYENLPTPTMRANGKLMIFSDLAELFPETTISNISSENTSNLCVVPSFGKTSITPFGHKMSKAYDSNEIILPEHILGFSGTTDVSKFLGNEFETNNAPSTSVSVNLNSQWRKSSSVSNPNSTLYDGVYESYSNTGEDDSIAIMYITIKGYTNFKVYIRSYAESNYDYVMISQLDQTINYYTNYSDVSIVKAHTRGNQQSGNSINNYTLVEYTNIDGGQHTICVAYIKDISTSSGDDKGYVLIPKTTETKKSIYSTNIYITPELTKLPEAAGDVAYWNGFKVKTTPLSSYSTSLGTAIGVVAIPKGFAPDGKTRIVSLKQIDTNGNPTDVISAIKWGEYGTDTSLTNYGKIPTTDNAGSTSTGSYTYAYLPSDNFSGTTSFVDPLAKYPAANRMIPSPYLGEAPNPEYYKTIAGNNVLSDFNGLSNTQTLVGLGTGYTAANACWKYKDGSRILQWYLPAMGELGYIMPRFKIINNAITTLGGVAIFLDYYWSSTENTGYYAYGLYAIDGMVDYLNKNDSYLIRPFAKLD